MEFLLVAFESANWRRRYFVVFAKLIRIEQMGPCNDGAGESPSGHRLSMSLKCSLIKRTEGCGSCGGMYEARHVVYERHGLHAYIENWMRRPPFWLCKHLVPAWRKTQRYLTGLDKIAMHSTLFRISRVATDCARRSGHTEQISTANDFSMHFESMNTPRGYLRRPLIEMVLCGNSPKRCSLNL